jgi:hypothetical protein
MMRCASAPYVRLYCTQHQIGWLESLLWRFLALRCIGASRVDFKHWIMYVLLASSGLAILQFFMRSHVVIDYDKDIIQTKLWKVWSFVRQSRHGLADATAIQIEVQPMVESKSMVKKFLVFSDGQRIELPEAMEIENILSDWYEHFFQRRLPIQKNKRA